MAPATPDQQADGPSSDLLAGLTVAAYLIPQCLAYGELAGLPAIHGLWAILPALLLYALLGSSPQLSVGPESTTAVLTAAAVAPLAGGDPAQQVLLSSVLALLVGLVCLAAGWSRLGVLADLLSRPVLAGYMAGVAVLMIRSQIGTVTGLAAAGGQAVHGPTLMLAAGVLALLPLLRRWVPQLPGPLLAVLLASLATGLLHLDQQGVTVIGPIPTGLPAPAWAALPPLPQLRPLLLPQLRPLLASALGIALVGYSDTILTGRAFAGRQGNHLDANREWLALGAANLGSGLVQGFPVSSSGSRTAIAAAAGSHTQRFSLVALAAVLVVLLAGRSLLARFPEAALGALVIDAALRLIDGRELRRLWRFRRSEAHLALLTLVGVLAAGLLSGVAIAVGLSLIDLLAKVVRPHAAVLGSVPGLAGHHDVRDWPGARTQPGLVIFRYDAPLCFANAEDFRRRVLTALEAETSPVRWLLINAEAIVDLDSTAAAMLLQLEQELAGRRIVLALARVKQELLALLERAGLVERIGPTHLFPTLPTAIAAFEAQQTAAGAAPPPEAASPP